MGRLPSSTFCVAIMCSVENLEGIVITDRDGVIILEGKPEEGITSFSTMFENSLCQEIHIVIHIFPFSYIC